jgi:valyl-tRNA synthetase
VAKIISENEEYFRTLASVSEIELVKNKDKIPKDAVSAVIGGAELFLPLEELIDFEKEIERLEKEKSKLESEIKRVLCLLKN